MGGAAVRMHAAACMALEPRLELAVGRDEVAHDLDDEFAHADGFAMDLLVVGGVAVEFELELAGQGDVDLRRRQLLFDLAELHGMPPYCCAASRGRTSRAASRLMVVAAISIAIATRPSA